MSTNKQYAVQAGSCTPATGDWVVVDIGFSTNSKSCGIQVDKKDTKPRECQFGELTDELIKLIQIPTDQPINLVIEAPLSVAFNKAGNPIGRALERHEDGRTRYWYVGLGSCVMVAAMYVLRAIIDAKPQRPVYLYEGFISFKDQTLKSDHAADVRLLRELVTQRQIFMPVALDGGELSSAFAVMGLSIGVAPVVGALPQR